MSKNDCPLCNLNPGDELIWENDRLYVVFGQDPLFPNYTKVIWKAHIKESCDLSMMDQIFLFKLLALLQEAQQKLLKADKVNLAEFGNMVPHLHWHVIPRYHNDPKFPQAYFHPQLVRPIDEQYVKEQEELHILYKEALREILRNLDASYEDAIEKQTFFNPHEFQFDEIDEDDDDDLNFFDSKTVTDRKLS